MRKRGPLGQGTEQSLSVFTENSNTETHQREQGTRWDKSKYLLEHNITKDVWSGMRETTLTPPKGKVEEQLREMTNKFNHFFYRKKNALTSVLT